MYSYKENYLIHFGVPGMKWGHRKARISSGSGFTRTSNKKTTQQVKAARKQKLKTAAKVGAGLAAGALAAYGGYKLKNVVKSKNMDIAKQKAEALWIKEFNKSLNVSSKAMRDSRKNGTSRKIAVAYSNKLSENAQKRGSDIINKARNDSFKDATKNVINYYRKKK